MCGDDDGRSIDIVVYRLQQYSLNKEKKSSNIVDDDASSCDNDESESEEPDEGNLRLVIVKSTLNVCSKR